MTRLSVSPEEMRTQVKNLEDLRRQHQELMKKMRVLVLGLSEHWKGEAQEAFQQSFLNRAQTMNEFSATLAQYAALMKQAADDAEEMDYNLLRMVNRRLG